MSERRRAMTGPAAAALRGLDGFRDETWLPLWCAPHHASSEPGIIRTRHFDRHLIDGIPVAPVAVVLRHLHGLPDAPIPAMDRVELAVEHAIRRGDVTLDDLAAARSGGAHPGDHLLRAVLRRRPDEPPTESYAETRFVQLARSAGISLWRQVEVVDGRRRYRVDFVAPFRARRRPSCLTPADGILIEIDGREFHDTRFEEDYRRRTSFEAMSFRWLAFTPVQVEREPRRVVSVVRSVLAAGGHHR
jgi:very-short-patch-repair endonuclease